MIKKFVAGLFMLFVACEAGAAKEDVLVNINPNGLTTIESTLGGSHIRVMVRTHEVEVTGASREKPRSDQASCTFSRHPCIVVDAMNISVNGSDLFVPRSLYADLSDLTKAALGRDGKGMKLTLYGGDASESFVLQVSFNTSRIRQRVLSSALSPDEPLQETTYYERVMGD